MFIANNVARFSGWVEDVYMADTLDELLAIWQADGNEVGDIYIMDTAKNKVFVVETSHKLVAYKVPKE